MNNIGEHLNVPKNIYLIKPRREGNSHPVLNDGVVYRNAQQKIDTCLVFDLNVLADMEKVLKGERSIEETGLEFVVNLLNNVRGLHLVPGFGFSEVSEDFLQITAAGFEEFISTYCSKYIDAPNSTKFGDDKPRSAYYSNLGDREKVVLCAHYLGMLKTRLLDRENIRAYEKFDKYISYMCDHVDVLSPIEAEVAKYVFLDPNKIEEESLRLFCVKIRDNFRKSAGTSGKMLRMCLNAARDLYYFKMAASSYVFPLDGKSQDAWLITGDAGLANLASSIYYVSDASFGPGALTSGIIPYQDKYEYFYDCNELVHKKSEQRQKSKKRRDPEEIISSIRKCIDELEADISSKLPEK